jgi:hypothetical protein
MEATQVEKSGGWVCVYVVEETSTERSVRKELGAAAVVGVDDPVAAADPLNRIALGPAAVCALGSTPLK